MILSMMLLAVILGVFVQTPTAVLPQAPPPVAPATAPAAIPRVARISGSVTAKMRTHVVEPKYPAEAKAEHLNGAVVLHVIVGMDGMVEKADAVHTTNAVFNDAAVEAVKQWRYKPYLLNGEPTEVDTTVVINFVFAD